MCSVTRYTHTHRLTAVVEARLWPPGTYGLGLGLLGPGLGLSLESFIDNVGITVNLKARQLLLN